MDWTDAAAALWGPDWIAPLSDVWGVNRRTVERWRSGDGAPREPLQAWLIRQASRADADGRMAGDILRRLARGETAAQILGEAHHVHRILLRLESDDYTPIAMRQTPRDANE